jgi:short-subunit dehydrogenase
VKTEAVDLSSQSAVQALYERVRGQSISTWINNAGLGDWNFAWDIPIEKMVSMLDLNVKALGLLSLMFVRDNLDKDATLINVASIAGYSLFPASIPYCATKFYVTALTEGLMHDVVANDHRVKVKLLVPGPIDTDFTRISLQETKLQMPDSSSVVFHSPEQMADFCYQLYGSDSSVGMVSLPDMTFHLRDPIHPIASL